MKFVIQRVNYAAVRVNEQIIGEINKGFLVFIGVEDADTEQTADKMVKKMLGLRIFSDQQDKINLSLSDASGEVLLVSQFTLYADCKHGNRPSFVKAGNPTHANKLYEYIISITKHSGLPVQTGSFGADMKITLENDGPFTIILDSSEF